MKRWGFWEWSVLGVLGAVFLAWMALVGWGAEALVSWAVAP